MKKRIVAVTCVLMFCLGLIGCGTERADKTQQLIRGAAPGYNDGLIRVGMIQTGKESDWRDANTNDYLNTFTKERGYDLIYIDGNSSSERQVKAMYDLIQQKVDYIILQPIVETGWEDAIHAAKEAGIPVIVADRKIAVDETEYVSWIGSDFEEEGRKAVTWLDQYLTEQGRENETIHIVLLEGTEGATAAIGRSDYYIPLNSSYNIPVAYIIVGISTENVRREQLTYLGYITIIVTSITVLFGVFMIWFMQHNVLGPLNAMSKAASSYSIAILRDGKESPISRMNIRTGDELERLCESMKKMEHDIIASSSQLAIADWNSNHDSMTQLYNKRHYKEQLKELQNDCTIGVIYFDIDNLKRMNDTFGHEKGDAVILKAAEFIRRYLTEQASGFRIGGDEFVMLIRDCTEEKVQELVSTMRGDEKGNLSDVTAEFYCRLAIGGAFRKTAETLEETIKRADDEMYKNKHSVRKA